MLNVFKIISKLANKINVPNAILLYKKCPKKKLKCIKKSVNNILKLLKKTLKLLNILKTKFLLFVMNVIKNLLICLLILMLFSVLFVSHLIQIKFKQKNEKKQIKENILIKKRFPIIFYFMNKKNIIIICLKFNVFSWLLKIIF
jgi:hypothetical protein